MRKIWLISSLLCMTVVLSGCWDRYELEERANILGLAVDIASKEDVADVPKVTHKEGDFPKDRKDTLYKVTAQLAVPGKIKLGPEGGGGEGSEKTSWVLETYGHTMKDAMANLQQQLAEKLYLGHLQIVVVSEAVAQRGLSDINDFLRRDHEVRRTAWMAVNKNDAAEVLKTAPPIETVPALYISETLDNAVRFGKLPREYLGKYWIDMSDKGVDGLLPAIKVIDGDRIMVDGLVYFNEREMAGRMTPIEIGAYMGMKEKNPGGYSLAVSVEEDGGKGVFLVKSKDRDSRILVSMKNGVPSATIDMKIDAIIEEQVLDEYINQDTIKKIEKSTSKKMEEICKELLNNLQEKGSDVLGIGGRVRAKFGYYWDEEVKTDERWSQIYSKMDIKVSVKYRIKSAGMEWN